MIRGNKKQQLEHSLQIMLWNFAKQVGLSDEYEIKCLIHKLMSKKIDAIIHRFGNEKKNLGDLGLLRSWIKERRANVTTSGPITRKAELTILKEFKRQTKLLMNGDNINRVKKCPYLDPEEKIEIKLSPTRSKMIPYYCGKSINYGYEFCKDHYQIVKLKREEIAKEKKNKDTKFIMGVDPSSDLRYDYTGEVVKPISDKTKSDIADRMTSEDEDDEIEINWDDEE